MIAIETVCFPLSIYTRHMPWLLGALWTVYEWGTYVIVLVQIIVYCTSKIYTNPKCVAHLTLNAAGGSPWSFICQTVLNVKDS